MSGHYSLHAAALAQIGATIAVGILAVALTRHAGADPGGIPLLLALLQGGLAAIIAKLQSAPPWWLSIHLAFGPLVVLCQQIDVAPGWYLAVFLALLLIYWRTDQSHVPLYLTNRATAAAIAQLLPQAPHRIVDLGCGEGGLLYRLAQTRPDCVFVGVEHAPLPWLIARLRNAANHNITLRRGSFWNEPLGSYQVIYAFLSPAPMAQLWEKLRREMVSDAIFVSNSFPVPGVRPTRIVDVADGRSTRLYLYRSDLAFQSDKAHDSSAFPTTSSPVDRE